MIYGFIFQPPLISHISSYRAHMHTHTQSRQSNINLFWQVNPGQSLESVWRATNDYLTNEQFDTWRGSIVRREAIFKITSTKFLWPWAHRNEVSFNLKLGWSSIMASMFDRAFEMGLSNPFRWAFLRQPQSEVYLLIFKEPTIAVWSFWSLKLFCVWKNDSNTLTHINI